jgi:predicted metal-dependent hydrolase
MLTQIEEGGIPVDVRRKNIRHVHLRVYPPLGTVRVTAPFSAGLQMIRDFIVAKLEWIRYQQKRVRTLVMDAPFAYQDGDRLFIRGARCTLRVIEAPGRPSASLVGDQIILRVRPGSGMQARKLLLERWRREELKRLIPPLLDKWQPLMGVRVAEWGVKKMKTRWGTCNPWAGRIWLNLELIKRPDHHLELIVVHELAHFLERSHGPRFKAIMDRHLPLWRQHRAELKCRIT